MSALTTHLHDAAAFQDGGRARGCTAPSGPCSRAAAHAATGAAGGSDGAGCGADGAEGWQRRRVLMWSIIDDVRTRRGESRVRAKEGEE